MFFSRVDMKKNVAYNNIRVAEVWMDEFKYLYYDRLGELDKPVDKRLEAYGLSKDIAERKKFREGLGCKSFKWYLDNVAKGFPYHNLIGAGEIRNEEMGFCLDQNDHLNFEHQPVYTIPCHGEAGNQVVVSAAAAAAAAAAADDDDDNAAAAVELLASK